MNKDEDKQVEKENTEGAINRLTREVKELRHDLDITDKKVETQKEMTEEVLASLASLKQFTVSQRQHQDLKTEEVKDEVKETQAVIKGKIEDVKEVIKKKKIIRIPDGGFLKKLLFWK